MIRIIHSIWGGMIDWINCWISWESIKAFGNSNFFTALIGSAAGAYFGAKAAQKITERAKLREELLQEIRSTNVALTFCWSICNSALNLKSQLIKPIYSGYEQSLKSCQEHKQARRDGRIPGNIPFHFEADLRSLQILQLPVPELKHICTEKISANDRGLALILTINQTYHGLNQTITMRNELINIPKFAGFDINKLVPWYFGFPLETESGSVVSEEFRNNVYALRDQTDDLIFFMWLLCKDLRQHGLSLLEQYRKLAKSSDIKIKEPLFGDAETNGLIPDPEKYKDWVNWGKKSAEAQTG